MSSSIIAGSLIFVEESLIWLLISLEWSNGFLFDFANFSSSFDIINCVFPIWATSCESSDEIFLNFCMLRVLVFAWCGLPIQVSGNVSFIMNWILKMLEWTLLITSQWVSEHYISIHSIIIFNSEPSVMLQDIWISTTSITLIIECGSFHSWGRWSPLRNVTVIFG